MSSQACALTLPEGADEVWQFALSLTDLLARCERERMELCVTADQDSDQLIFELVAGHYESQSLHGDLAELVAQGTTLIETQGTPQMMLFSNGSRQKLAEQLIELLGHSDRYTIVWKVSFPPCTEMKTIVMAIRDRAKTPKGVSIYASYREESGEQRIPTLFKVLDEALNDLS